MTKRDFIAFAAVLRNNKPNNIPLECQAVLHYLWQSMRNGMADVMQESNPAFDRARFMEACEPNERD